jgi:exodeoxyribonuclease VII small subunit
MAKKKNKNSFEDELKRLEEISSILEDENVGLDEAMNLYEEGIKLSKDCIRTLKKAELKITELQNELGKIVNDTEEELFEN